MPHAGQPQSNPYQLDQTQGTKVPHFHRGVAILQEHQQEKHSGILGDTLDFLHFLG